MKVSLEWVKEFVTIRIPIEVLCERLTMGGLEVVGIDKKGEDTILEIEITPNRPDLLSHIGIAREIAALTGTRLKFPRQQATSHPSTPLGMVRGMVSLPNHKRQGVGKLPLRISIQDTKGCLRYIGRLLDHVEVGPTPSWLKERLERLGVRSVNNAVDITNYVLLEAGQPLHAFDYDKIEGGEIIIRSARRGETLLTIDGENRILQEGELVIADAKKPVALAGVIGGKDTEITPNTKRVLLESAFFDPVRVRHVSKRLGISTESSYRFERGVSLEGVQRGSERASFLLLKWAKATAASSLDRGQKSFPSKDIHVSLQEIEETLGISLPSSRTRALLSSLGCRVNQKGKSLYVTPPPFRRDLQEPVDLAEEVGRLLGYDRIPVTVPLRERVSLEKGMEPVGDLRRIEKRIKDFLVSQGLFEVVTYSLLSRALLKAFFGERDDTIPIRNPISLEQEMLRSSLIPRLAEVAAYNHHRKAEGVPIFEIGPVYGKAGRTYLEGEKLAILLSGARPGNWKMKSSPYDYFDLKGICEALLGAFCPSSDVGYERTPAPCFSPKSPSMRMKVGEREIGTLGELSSSILQFFDLRGKIFVAELSLEALVSLASAAKRYVSLPKHPSIRRDISLIVREETSSEELVQMIRAEGGSWVRDVSLFDTYTDPRIVPEGSRGLAYRIEFLHPDRTLTDEEVNEKYQRILEALKSRGAQIR